MMDQGIECLCQWMIAEYFERHPEVRRGDKIDG